MTLHFLEYGSGHPFIILHGFLGSLDNWHTLGKEFGTHFRVMALDQRNHGRSPHSETFTYDAMAEDLREFFDNHHLPSAHVLGHSMGGKTAMLFALLHPERVDTLTVVDIAPRSYPPEHDQMLDALLSLDLTLHSSRNQVDSALRTKIRDTAVRQFLLKNLTRDESAAFLWKMNLKAIYENYAEILKAITSGPPLTKPALFIRGTRSDHIRDSDIPEIRRLFLNAEIVGIDAGHWVHADAPKEFSRVVLNFLNRSSHPGSAS